MRFLEKDRTVVAMRTQGEKDRPAVATRAQGKDKPPGNTGARAENRPAVATGAQSDKKRPVVATGIQGGPFVGSEETQKTQIFCVVKLK